MVKQRTQDLTAGINFDGLYFNTDIYVYIIQILVAVVAALFAHCLPRELRAAQRPVSGEKIAARKIRQGSINTAVGDFAIVNAVQPVSETVAALGNLQLDRANDRVVVVRVEVALLEGRCAAGHDDRAHVGIGVRGPFRRRRDGVGDVVPGDPARGLVFERARLNLVDKRAGPGLRIRELGAANLFLRNVRVPVGVKVVRVAVKGHLDVVAADLVRLVVQRLRDVAEKVHEELERLVVVVAAQAPVADALRVVGNGRDGAALAAAVALVVDVARRRRVVLGVDEVQRRGPLASRGGAVLVSPGGNGGQIRVGVVPENALSPVTENCKPLSFFFAFLIICPPPAAGWTCSPSSRLVGQVVLRNVSDGGVAQDTPSLSTLESSGRNDGGVVE